MDDSTGVNNASRAIIFKELSVLPASRSIALRQPKFKQEVFGTSPLSPEEAFSGSNKSRVGEHNDCFLADSTDEGTYPDDSNQRTAMKAYLNVDNQFVPQGGETCNAGPDAAPYIACPAALATMRYLRYHTLNIDYQPQVIQLWKTKKCFNVIANSLGYRFRLTSVSFTNPTPLAGNLTVKVTLVNDGFGTPYNPRGLELILRNVANHQIVMRSNLLGITDPRRWLGSISFTYTTGLPVALSTGSYQILLNLPDPMPSLYGRPEYSIQFANKNVWEPSTGFNILGVVRLQ